MRMSVESVVRVGITLGLGVIGAAAGFTHTHDAAEHAGQHGWLAWADAVVIECMAVFAGFQIKANPRHAVFPTLVLVVSFVGQMAAQVSQAPRTPAGWLFAATPALGFLVVVKLAMRELPARGVPDVGKQDAPVSAVAQRDSAPVVEPVVSAEPERQEVREIPASPFAGLLSQ